MNYQRIYEQLTAKDMVADYTEKHHIIPRCMGGTNDPSNLVRLTPEAHYVAHQLLVKIYPTNSKLAFAATALTYDAHSHRVNNKLFGWIRRKLSETSKGKPSKLKGRSLSAEHKAKISAAGKLRPAASSETRAKLSAAGKRQPPKSAEAKAKHRAAITGKSRGTPSIETKAKISASNKGKTRSDKSKAKMSASQKGKSKSTVSCPYCNKEGGIPQMKQWHFDNCKHKG
jgi:hypothetical protein